MANPNAERTMEELLQNPTVLAIIAGVAFFLLRGNPTLTALIMPILRLLVPNLPDPAPGPTPGPGPNPGPAPGPDPDPNSTPLREVLKLILPNLVPILTNVFSSTTGRATATAILAQRCEDAGQVEEAEELRKLLPRISRPQAGDMR